KNLQQLKGYSFIIFLSINVYFPALTIFSILNKPLFYFSGIYFNPFVRGSSSYKNALRDFSLRTITKNYTNANVFVLNDDDSAAKLNVRYRTKMFNSLEDPVPTFFYRNSVKAKKGNE